MKYHAPENASFLFPFQFDPASLLEDLEKCMKFDFIKNYVPANYDGKNYILPLRSIDGRLDLPAASLFNSNQFRDTIVLKECSYFRHVIDTFKCEKNAVRLMNLTAGRVINTHTDHECGYEDGIFRIHVPILTNDKVYFTLNEKVLNMRPGEVWYTNVNLPHSVANNGETDRMHLVIDSIRNDWSDDLFKSAGYDFSLEREVEELLSPETVLRMIEELEAQSTPEAKLFLDRLKLEHGFD